MHGKLIYALVLLTFLTQPLFSREYSLDKILELARENNKQIKLALADKQLASAQMKEAISTALPKINVDMGYNRNFLENIFYFTVTDSSGKPVTQSFKASFRNEYRLNATLNQTIYSFGKVGNAISAARYYRKYTDRQFDTQFQTIITQVKKAFYQAVLLNEVWNVAVQSEASAKDNYLNLKTKYESGVVSEFDLLQAEVRWKNAIPATMQAKKNYFLALNNLKALVEIPLGEEITLVGDLKTVPSLPDSIGFSEVLMKRPDFQALLIEKKLQQKRVAVEFSNHLPTLLGSLTYTYGAQSDQFRLENDNDNVILGLSLQVPIFSGGYTSAQVQKAKVDVQKVSTRIDMARENMQIELDNLALRMREAFQRIVAAEKSVGTARRSYEIAESRVQYGQATQLELKDSRVLLDQAQLTYYSAIYDYLNAKFDWDLATGSVNTDSLY